MTFDTSWLGPIERLEKTRTPQMRHEISDEIKADAYNAYRDYWDKGGCQSIEAVEAALEAIAPRLREGQELTIEEWRQRSWHFGALTRTGSEVDAAFHDAAFHAACDAAPDITKKGTE
jgi:hypothetical protein